MALLHEAHHKSRLHAVSPSEQFRVVSIQETTIYSFAAYKEAKEKDEQPETLPEYITYFDSNWIREGLQADWYTLENRIGFSMRTQMQLLQGTDVESIAAWQQRTREDVVGFKLEYLSDHLIYPAKYELNKERNEMRNVQYGKDVVDTAVEKERNGTVKQALVEMKAFFLDPTTPDGSIAILPSPKGPSGLTLDNGAPISYPDSYWFIMQKSADTVTNYTLKTDFSHDECRKAIASLSGRELDAYAPVEDYVVPEYFSAEAETHLRPQDIVRTLAGVRQRAVAFENISWDDVYKDIAHAESLYEFDTKTQKIIGEFVDYPISENTTQLELQKALAATILRISKLFIEEDQQKKQPQRKNSVHDHTPVLPLTFGTVLHAVAQRPGCAGGGKNSTYQSSGRTIIESVTSRVGSTTQEWFTCPKCEYKADGPIGNTCPGCGLTKEAFAEETGVVCD